MDLQLFFNGILTLKIADFFFISNRVILVICVVLKETTLTIFGFHRSMESEVMRVLSLGTTEISDDTIKIQSSRSGSSHLCRSM